MTTCMCVSRLPAPPPPSLFSPASSLPFPLLSPSPSHLLIFSSLNRFNSGGLHSDHLRHWGSRSHHHPLRLAGACRWHCWCGGGEPALLSHSTGSLYQLGTRLPTTRKKKKKKGCGKAMLGQFSRLSLKLKTYI